MDVREKQELCALYARIEDLCERAERGELAYSSFLSPRELHYAKVYMAHKGLEFYDFGGYEDAERRKIYIFPEYMTRLPQHEKIDFSEFLREYGFDTDITVLKIVGSGYRKLTHRDFLGSLLGAGIVRSVVGDIAVESEEGYEAVVFCESAIASFIENELVKVANDKVTVTRPRMGEWKIPERKFASVSDTVASPRLDCAVAALCGFSREKARETVRGGLVEINFESEDRPDRTVTASSIISVRGFGRYRIVDISDRTRKGRYRLEAEKYL